MTDVRSPGSTVVTRPCSITDERLEGSVHFAAGIALCQESGCVITDFDDNAVHEGPGIIAARDRGSHATLGELVARHRSG